jgi:TatD DNase family protein
MLIDTHCHLSYPGLFENVRAVLARAAHSGATELQGVSGGGGTEGDATQSDAPQASPMPVSRFITIGTHIDDHHKALSIANAHAAVFAAIGIHPHHAAETDEGYDGFLEHRLRTEPKVVALGECGLDYHYDNSPRLVQRGVFVNQLEIARRIGIPVILHVRDAHADALSIMTDFPELRFVVHCFTGTPAECDAWLALGAYIGITGIVTYKNATDVQDAARKVPADKLLLETDAPYLSPEPVRKVKTNEPANVLHIARFVAQLRNIPLADLARQTTTNAATLFGEKLLQ